MHAYDAPRRPSFPSIPSARPGQDPLGGPSATPIYDALYAEYVKSFRSLPGDRSGEEELVFSAFESIPSSTGAYERPRPGSFSSSYGAYSAGAQSARQGLEQQGQWQRVGTLGQQQTATMRPVPAALPPGPRRGY
ncbi:hypothetical protein [Streptomyces sp. NPDC018693]|uniref:hypothetical protein n=1 Tax=unclassified Streptomyces TaxID=2593676 RepID=UPI0037AE6B83